MAGKAGVAVGSMRQAVEETPGIAAASIGLGLCIVLRMQRLQVASASFPPVELMVACTAILAIAMGVVSLIYGRRPGLRLHRNPVVAVVLSLACAVSSLFAYGSFSVQISFEGAVLCEAVLQVGANLLLLMWGETLYAYGRTRTVVVFGLACGVAALATAMLGFVKTDMEAGVLAMVPVLTAVCLYFFIEYNTSRSGFGVGQGMAMEHASGLPANRGALSCPMKSLVSLMAFFFLVRFCIGHVTTSWTILADGQGASVASQLSSSLGMLGVAVVLAGYSSFDFRDGVRLYPALILSILTVALLVVFALDGAGAWTSIALNVSEQLLLILPAFVSPFLYRAQDGKPAFFTAPLIFGACAAGSAVGAACQVWVPSEILTPLLVAMVAVLVGLAAVLYRQGSGCAPSGTGGACAEGGAGGTPIVAVDPLGREDAAVLEACGAVAARYQLTRREKDILTLLAMRYTNAEVSESLVISMATVRTHIRNIYAKLDIHSVKELRELCEGGSSNEYENQCEERTGV